MSPLPAPQAAAAGRLNVGLLGVVSLVPLVLAQVYLEANITVIALAAASALLVVALLANRPYDVGSWFATLVFLQLFGGAWIYKTLLLIPLDQGLVHPIQSMAWGFLLVTAATAGALMSRFRQKPGFALERLYRDPARWVTLGWALFALGEFSKYAAYLVNSGGRASFGGFGPLGGFTIAGTVFLANSAARKGHALDWRVTAVLLFAVANSLVFNSKGDVVFQASAVAFCAMLGPASRFKKAVLLTAFAGALLVADQTLFPLIHTLRGGSLRSASLGKRVALIQDALVQGRREWKQVDEGEINILTEHGDFVPSSSFFMRRFGSLHYLDVTLAGGAPGSAGITPEAFLRGCLARALPGPLSPGKDNSHQLADKLWIRMDERMRDISQETMGSFASARLIFGDWEGWLITAGAWMLTLWAFRRFYGGDVRAPLVQYLLIHMVYPMVDEDIECQVLYLMRLLWQDVAILALAGWLVARVSSPAGPQPPVSVWANPDAL